MNRSLVETITKFSSDCHKNILICPELLPIRMLTGSARLSKIRTIQNLDSNLIERKIQEIIYVTAEDVFSKGFFQTKFQENVQKYFSHVLKELGVLIDQLLISYKMTSLIEKLGNLPEKIESNDNQNDFKGNLVISKF